MTEQAEVYEANSGWKLPSEERFYDLTKFIRFFEYLKEQYSLGTFLVSGRKVPRTGGVILASASSREEIENIIALDPFYTYRIASYEITEFSPTMTMDELAFLKE